jgi:hypothetical protein
MASKLDSNCSRFGIGRGVLPFDIDTSILGGFGSLKGGHFYFLRSMSLLTPRMPKLLEIAIKSRY